jgi:tetratricopeptide (TPR) repeat protein
LAFRRGVCHQQLGELRPAEALFRQAREQDALQFRADDRINTIIRQSAEAHANRRVSLVDADKLFAAKSSGGLTGGELFYEHVHLVPEANYLLAQAVAQRAEEALSLKGSRPWPSLADCLHLLGFTDWNRYDALDVILDRIQSAPFTNQVNHADQIQKINEQREHFRSASKPAQLRREAAEVGALLNRYPEDPDLRWNLAMLFETAGDTAGAEAQWRALLALQPRATLPVFNLAKLLEGGNRPAEALALYLDCLNKDPEYYPARYAAGRLCLESHSTDQALRHLKLALRQKPGAIEARLALAQALAQAGNKSGAEMQVRQILRLDPNNPSARRYLGELRPGSPEP